jgi:Short C-terminal domain
MGLVRGMARTAVVAGTATAVSNRVSRRQAERWDRQAYEQQGYGQPAYQQQAYAAPAPPPPDPAPAGGGPEMTAELERLATLRNQGVLTDAEFAAAKAKLLGI